MFQSPDGNSNADDGQKVEGKENKDPDVPLGLELVASQKFKEEEEQMKAH